jgi:outer membrane lipoprotein-sorting protein
MSARSNKSRLVLITMLVLIAAALTLTGTRFLARALSRAQLAEALNNVRQLKFAFDGYASDFDGQFPTELTGMTLEPGDYRWAYVTGQNITSAGGRPLVLDPFLPGADHFDPELWDKKAIILQVDGSASAHRLNEQDRVSDEPNEDIFSIRARAWEGFLGDPTDFLVQPAP